MKKLFVTLLIINVALFAWVQLGEPGWKNLTVNQQQPLNEAKIRLVDDNEEADERNKTGNKIEISGQALTDLPQPLKAERQTQVNTTSINSEQEATVCLEWGEFTGAILERAGAALSELSLGAKLSQSEMEYETGYWIYMGPYKNRKTVNKKIGELKDIGVNEYYVVPSGRWKNTISLGVFKSEDAAKNLFNQLTEKGVRTAKMGERSSKLKTTIFIFQNINTETKAKIRELQKQYAGSEVKDVPCALTR